MSDKFDNLIAEAKRQSLTPDERTQMRSRLTAMMGQSASTSPVPTSTFMRFGMPAALIVLVMISSGVWLNRKTPDSSEVNKTGANLEAVQAPAQMSAQIDSRTATTSLDIIETGGL